MEGHGGAVSAEVLSPGASPLIILTQSDGAPGQAHTPLGAPSSPPLPHSLHLPRSRLTCRSRGQRAVAGLPREDAFGVLSQHLPLCLRDQSALSLVSFLQDLCVPALTRVPPLSILSASLWVSFSALFFLAGLLSVCQALRSCLFLFLPTLPPLSLGGLSPVSLALALDCVLTPSVPRPKGLQDVWTASCSQLPGCGWTGTGSFPVESGRRASPPPHLTGAAAWLGSPPARLGWKQQKPH